MNKETTSRIEELKEVWTPEANWYVQTPRGEAVFVHRAFGPGNYNDIAKQVLTNRQKLPTGEQDAFMLDEAYNSLNKEVKNNERTKSVRDIMFNNWLWVPVVNIWTPNSIRNPGKYGVFDENGEGLGRVYTVEELEDKLSGGSTEKGLRFSKDGKVSFAPGNTIRAGNHDKGTLKDDGAFIGNYGVEGAERLDKIAGNFSLKPYSWIVNNTSDKPIQTLSALSGGGYFDDNRLLAGFGSGGDRVGYVLSVSGSENGAEGTAPKK